MRSMKRFIAIISFTVLAASVSAETLDAVIRILDEHARLLSGAVLKIEASGAEVTPSEDGLFRVPVEAGTMVSVMKPNEYYRVFYVENEECTIQLTKADRLLSNGYDGFVTARTSASAIDGVAYQDFEHSSQTQVMNTLYGLIPGLNLTMTGSEPWASASSPGILVRGTGSYTGSSVLVLVDGVPRDVSTVDAREVQSVTVLKDAASLALYGVRGADGAVLVTTKRGGNKGMSIKAGYQFGVLTPSRIPEMADAEEYANALNEAYLNDGLAPYYTAADLKNIASGNSPIPSVNWQDQLLRNYGFDHNVHMTMDGSTGRSSYFVYADVRSSRGFFDNTKHTEGMSSQLEYTSLKLRSNLDVKVTNTTDLTINLSARLQQQNQPYTGTDLTNMYTTPSVGFPVFHNETWARSSIFVNPLEEKTGRGYTALFSRFLSADLTLKQDLSAITEGLSIEARVSYDNNANTYDSKTYSSVYYIPLPTRNEAGDITGYTFNEYGNDTEIAFGTGLSMQYMYMDLWAKLDYDRTFGKHKVNAAAIFNRSRMAYSGPNAKYTYHDYILGADYNYDGRFIINATGTMSGSSRLQTGDKFRFYPAVGAAWVVSNEDFMNGKMDLLKVKFSAGITGQDAFLSYDMDKQFNGEGYSYIFNGATWSYGQMEGNLPSKNIEPEKDMKLNMGVELALRGGFYGEANIFYSRRENIRNAAGTIVSGILGVGLTDVFTGEAENYGAELSLGYRGRTGNFDWHIRGNAAYTRNRIISINEEYAPQDYLYRQGGVISAFYGLESDGFYQTADFDPDGNLLTSVPKNTFAAVRPGDVKYKDLNDDKRIDQYDYKYYDKSLTPVLYYGVQFGFAWNGLYMNAQFQGAGGHIIQTSLASIYQPLYGGNKNISKHYLESYWTESDTQGRYPRLTSLANNNNYRPSDMWTEKGDYLKLRELELGYRFSARWLNTVRINEMSVFLRGNNLFSIDRIKILDPEYISTGYPFARTCSVGINLDF